MPTGTRSLRGSRAAWRASSQLDGHTPTGRSAVHGPWYNQETGVPASHCTAVGTFVAGSPSTITTTADQPLYTSCCPDSNGYNPVGNAGLLFVKAVRSFELTGDFTAWAWVRPSVLRTLQTVFSLEKPGQVGSLCVRSDALILNTNVIVPNGGLNTYLTLNQWAHVAVTRSTGRIALWVDGVERAAMTGVTNTINPYSVDQTNTVNCGLFLGVSGHDGKEKWAGRIAEFALSGDYIDVSTMSRITPTV
jgi:hypothetical protein